MPVPFSGKLYKKVQMGNTAKIIGGLGVGSFSSFSLSAATSCTDAGLLINLSFFCFFLSFFFGDAICNHMFSV